MSITRLDTLIGDLLFIVLSYLSPRDILTLRKTCRSLRQATLDRSVWANAYRTSTYLRPAGPLESQSRQELEKNLIRAEKLDENWTASASPVSRRSIDTGTGNPFSMSLAQGRYLFVGDSKGLRCYDLDSENYTTPIFDRQTPVRALACTPWVDHEGKEFIVLAISPRQTSTPRIIIYKIHANPSPTEFDKVAQIEVETVNFFSLRIRGDFLLSRARDSALLFDLRTHRWWKLPGILRSLYQLRITDQHVLGFHPQQTTTEVEAFQLPVASTTEILEKKPYTPCTQESVNDTLIKSHYGVCAFSFHPESNISFDDGKPISPQDTTRTRLLTFQRDTGVYAGAIRILDLVLAPHDGLRSTAPASITFENVFTFPRADEFSPFRFESTSVGGCTRGFNVATDMRLHESTVVANNIRGSTLRDDPPGTSLVADSRELVITEPGGPQLYLATCNIAFDGVRGRLCIELPPSNAPRIGILDFV
ncbi:hypothetical protein JAAARDRAFT_30951 [Jaapia argillacea MUCL 33604]|uniref:F-box domain-containing protein n=1 Tax=Jaapia argillacea MUCL 33604 TaxID=933084 RepID=A0A067QDD8_9AGAM|nr:hypothetical protein JAAARDRAFT_30951 [Jaapia argillacea MUCL 33604]